MGNYLDKTGLTYFWGKLKSYIPIAVNIFESGLGAKSSLTNSDYIRVVGSDNNSYKQSIASVANAVGAYNATLILLTDCNDATDPSKIYYANGSTANKPTTDWWFIRCEAKSGSMLFQTAYAMNYKVVSVYQRSRDNTGAWGAWTQLPTRAEVDALARVYRKARTYSNITIPSEGYVKIDSFADMGVSTSLFLISIIIAGWTGSDAPRIVKGGNGVDIYAMGTAGTYQGFNAQYYFVDTPTAL